SSQATNFCPAGVSGTFTWPEHGAETHSSHRTSTALTRIAIRPMRYSFLTVNLPLRTALTTALKGRRAAVALWSADGVARRCDVRRQVFERSSGVRDRLLMRQPRFERGTFGSGGGTGQRPPTLAVVVSGTYASRASASASQRRPRCYHRCYRGSLLRRCVGAAPPCTCIRSAARDGEGSQCGVPAAFTPACPAVPSRLASRRCRTPQ